MGKRYTEEERQAVDAKRELLAEAARIMEEQRPADIDKAARILSAYSRRNIALILIQAEQRGQQFPQAVAGFHAWRAAAGPPWVVVSPPPLIMAGRGWSHFSYFPP